MTKIQNSKRAEPGIAFQSFVLWVLNLFRISDFGFLERDGATGVRLRRRCRISASRGLALALLVLLGTAPVVRGERIKDIVDIQGVRSNPLTGIGLVTGLAGTGDTTLLSRQMLTNVLRDSGLVLSPTDLTGKNVAVVMVTAELGPFDREGSRIDVDVSTLGDATASRGRCCWRRRCEVWTDRCTPWPRAASRSAAGPPPGNQASAAKNHQTVGRIPDGAIVEKSELATFIEQVAGQRYLTLNLRNNDFTTAQRISDAINQAFPGSAVVLDAGAVRVTVPGNVTQQGIVGFLDEITKKDVTVDMPATVVINERTGTIVVGENVGISAVAISQGSLVVKVKESAQVSQPMAPFSDAGRTEVIPETIAGHRGAECVPDPGGEGGDGLRAGQDAQRDRGLAAGSDRDLQRPEEGGRPAGQADHHVGTTSWTESTPWRMADGGWRISAGVAKPPSAISRSASRRAVDRSDEQKKQIAKDFESVLLTQAVRPGAGIDRPLGSRGGWSRARKCRVCSGSTWPRTSPTRAGSGCGRRSISILPQMDGPPNPADVLNEEL